LINFLYKWPEAAEFGRRVPKEKFYENGHVTTAVRGKFVSEVRSITWAYKLADSTINLPGSTNVPEIQVFHIAAKGGDVADQVLLSIDRAIQYPVVFEITREIAGETQVRMVAALKQLTSGASKLSAYYSTGWLSADAERHTLPTAISLPTLYAALLATLTQLTARPGEEMSSVADRLTTVRRIEREIAALERKLRSEPQLNRKVELRRSLQTKQQELEQQRYQWNNYA
jgi:hypothetical protein